MFHLFYVNNYDNLAIFYFTWRKGSFDQFNIFSKNIQIFLKYNIICTGFFDYKIKIVFFENRKKRPVLKWKLICCYEKIVVWKSVFYFSNMYTIRINYTFIFEIGWDKKYRKYNEPEQTENPNPVSWCFMKYYAPNKVIYWSTADDQTNDGIKNKCLFC